MTTRALPEGRYGPARSGAVKRWRAWAYGVIALVVSVAVAWVAYINLGPAPIDAERVAFGEQPGNAMSVTINVTRDDPGKPGVCIVRVRDISGAESGRKEVFVPAGDGNSRQTTVVRSIDRPVTADVFGCSYSVPAYLSSS
ncbi:DUF4307 domain-containing protein [Amycolatopsis sp. K13G38]|uniref:DUF4307 domain-containing protein n=1 Tax=Amycolatopsis acididurans TaxID=2724524 RepID=A0ABX1JA35_9PSEU|nr:DUF4307 domain-containing protein [Amycolatopsis acididurans]NKQ56631.1 DUF4307 domain-containing protein [Amycolatopsis acididurans]